MMSSCSIVPSSIIHVRHGTPSHRLERKGLSVWIDLDHLKEAGQKSALFSIGSFNLLSFHPADYGCNFKSGKTPKDKTPKDLAQYARDCAAEVAPELDIDQVMLLTFPRILGVSFNPISVYLCRQNNKDVLAIYEVRNTFGDMHSYIGRMDGDSNVVHSVKKNLHVSPFFSMDGEYRLKINADAEKMRLLIHYHDQETPRLTATLRGDIMPLSTGAILRMLFMTGQFPMRPLLSIHIEAVKLWFKKVRFFSRPEPAEAAYTVTEMSKNQMSKTPILRDR